jgi:hypothetical protein
MFYVTASTALKKGRGMAKCKNLSYYVVKNGPFILNIPNRHRAPIGENATWFASKIGEIVRNMCELHHDECPSSGKEQVVTPYSGMNINVMFNNMLCMKKYVSYEKIM